MVGDIQLPATGVCSAAAVFDRAGLAARMTDDEPVIQMVCLGFLLDIPRQIALLKEYLDAGDTKRVHRQAHSIHGASANVGGERLREVAFLIEQAAAADNLDMARMHFAALEGQFEALKQEMSKEYSTNPKSVNKSERKKQ
jgi:HPt (histidine-containing phosphotransfer) domain-containing protein